MSATDQCSAILPSRMRSMRIEGSVTARPVGGTPKKRPVCRACVTIWVTTRSPSETCWTTSIRTSEKAANAWKNCS